MGADSPFAWRDSQACPWLPGRGSGAGREQLSIDQVQEESAWVPGREAESGLSAGGVPDGRSAADPFLGRSEVVEAGGGKTDTCASAAPGYADSQSYFHLSARTPQWSSGHHAWNARADSCWDIHLREGRALAV